MKQLPNILTWSRLCAAPLLAGVFLTAPAEWRDIITPLLFILAALTDLLDGYLARRFNTVSRFGRFLDPIADKIIVITALLLVLDVGRAPLLAVIIIICREICVLGLRQWMAEQGRAALVEPSLPSKSKTALQMTAIALLLYGQDVGALPVLLIGKGLLWLAAVLAVFSLAVSLRTAFSQANAGQSSGQDS